MTNEIRANTVRFFFILVGIVFLTRLFYIQVIDDTYKLAADKNTIKKIPIDAYRGIIFDRNNNVLVYNSPLFELRAVPKEAVIRDSVKFCELLEIEIEDLREKVKTFNADRAYKYIQEQVYVSQISVEHFARIQDQFDFPGFEFAPKTSRQYPHKSLANILGYVAEIDQKQLDGDEENYYRSGDFVGKLGIEKSYEAQMRGLRGVEYKWKNVRNVIKGDYHDGKFDTLAVAGKDLYSTIDLKLQQYAEQLLNGKIGSVVAIEPKTGEILAIASSPSYDPNLLTGRNFRKNFSKLYLDTLKPLYDRSTQSSQPPGSTFKLAMAAIALEQGIITPQTRICLDGSLVGDHIALGCYTVHDAIRLSSNEWFFRLYKMMLQKRKVKNKYEDTEIGYDEWYKAVRSFGLGGRLGSDISHEKGGKVPDNAYYDRWYGDKRWKTSTIYSNAIGQGELLATPLQLANMTAAIANKGYYITPHTIRAIKDSVIQWPRHDTYVSEKHFDPIIEAMEAVVKNGTAGRAYFPHLTICGKTGTAENPHGEDHSIFVAFAPKEEPKIAVACYIENAGFGGTWAAPISALVIEKYLTDSTSNKWKENRILEKRFF